MFGRSLPRTASKLGLKLRQLLLGHPCLEHASEQRRTRVEDLSRGFGFCVLPDPGGDDRCRLRVIRIPRIEFTSKEAITNNAFGGVGDLFQCRFQHEMFHGCGFSLAEALHLLAIKFANRFKQFGVEGTQQVYGTRKK
uniref:(northern house mosquito) hypothetical protein n=1 Tax=Culex pipiens TaxID=7175 RepID=A0A8D8BXB0_CULPI